MTIADVFHRRVKEVRNPDCTKNTERRKREENGQQKSSKNNQNKETKTKQNVEERTTTGGTKEQRIRKMNIKTNRKTRQ